MVAYCWLTWVLYQCATVTPEACPTKHSQRFILESFIGYAFHRARHGHDEGVTPVQRPYILPLGLDRGKDPATPHPVQGVGRRGFLVSHIPGHVGRVRPNCHSRRQNWGVHACRPSHFGERGLEGT